ncbi:hypothetical protein [Prochlorococcus marinus]|uniref:hypothetical protein n=1 Tax=Prochlorococcus marinus TaxID=1219 RepID=UPI0003230289|nr:hypothetical protein [Prochlorococcus marinus]
MSPVVLALLGAEKQFEHLPSYIEPMRPSWSFALNTVRLSSQSAVVTVPSKTPGKEGSSTNNNDPNLK